MIKNIKTKNIKTEIEKYIEPFIERLSKRNEVLSIILLGGLGKRNFLDRFSDVDISIITTKKDIKKFPLPFEFHYENAGRLIEFNIHQLILEDELDISNFWCESKIEAYSNAIIVYDTNNYAKQILDTKVVFDKPKAYNRLIWIVQQYKWRGQIHSIRSFERGCAASSHNLLNNCVDLLLEAVFLINECYLPHKKWTFIFLDELNIGSDLKDLFMQAMIIKDFSYKCIQQRIDILDNIYKLILKMIHEKYSNFPNNPYEHYYKNHVQLNKITIADKVFYEKTGQYTIANTNDEQLFGQICFNVDKL